MTDLEMTKLCAEAMGYTDVRKKGDKVRETNIGGRDIPGIYWPLDDDAQAMALVKKCKLELRCVMEHWHCWYSDEAGAVLSTDLNRAIVECVAKMQRGPRKIPGVATVA